VDRASRAAETISQTAEALPAQISAEREAIMAALQEQQGQLSSLMNAGTEFSDSLTITITNFNALMRRFGVGEPRTNAAPAAPGARPFDILDYAKTAEQLTTMAGQLNETINELNAAVDSPALQKLSTQATSDARGLMNHAFLLVAGLVVLVLVCALIYRTLARRRPSA
jgi:hypothetical protein